MEYKELVNSEILSSMVVSEITDKHAVYNDTERRIIFLDAITKTIISFNPLDYTKQSLTFKTMQEYASSVTEQKCFVFPDNYHALSYFYLRYVQDGKPVKHILTVSRPDNIMAMDQITVDDIIVVSDPTLAEVQISFSGKDRTLFSLKTNKITVRASLDDLKKSRALTTGYVRIYQTMLPAMQYAITKQKEFTI